MKLIVIIPAYNEEGTIGEVIGKIPKKLGGISSIEVIVIDDGSTDRTVEIAKKAGAIVYSHSLNKGVGEAFFTGIKQALKMKADVIVNMDADGQFNPLDIPQLIKPILENKADMVTASRFLDKNLVPKMPFFKKIGNRIFTKMISNLTKQKFTDTQCGFRAYSKDAALNLNLFGKFTYTQEAILDLANKGLRIKEVPLKVRGQREKGESKVVKSIFSYGLRAIGIILRTIRDYKPLAFFGIPGAIIFSLGFLSGLFLIIRYILTQTTTPFQSLIVFSATMLILGFLMVFLALIADMLDRIRKNQERILYEVKEDGE